MGSTANQSAPDQSKIEGKVRDAAGQSIPEAMVTPIDAAGRPGRPVTAGRDGRFSLEVPEGASYKIRVSKDGFQTREVELGPIDEVRKTVEVRLEPARKVSGPEFSDEPNFTVAGVTDWNDTGLHGSNVNSATSESLVRDAAALRSKNEGKTRDAEGPGDQHRILGDAKERAGDPIGAVREYAEAAKLQPSEENYFAWGAELLLHRAGSAAIEVLGKGAADFPYSERMREALGAAYYENGQFMDASEAMCRASDLNPKDETPYLFLGRIEQAASGIFPCSEARLMRFATEYPTNARANYYRGFLSWKKARRSQNAEEYQEAERFLQRAAQLEPAQGEAYVQLGLLHNAQGKHGEALGEFQAAVKASPELSAAHYQLSLAYRRAGRISEAENEMRRYEESRKLEEALREKERKEMRQFVTVLKGAPRK